MAARAAFHCHFCPFLCVDWKGYMKHIFQCHSSTPNFTYICGISGCVQSFRAYTAYASHLQRKHSDCDLTQLQSVDCNPGGPPANPPNSNSNFQNESSTGCSYSTNAAARDCAKRSSALLLLSLKEKHRMTQSAVNFSIGQMKEVITHVLDDAKKSLKEHVGDGALIDSCFDAVPDPFLLLETEFLQTKFYRENFNLVVSIFAVNGLQNCLIK